MQAIRHAFRTLRKSPGFTCTAIAVLALGIGANTAVFSLLNTLLIRPLPYSDAGSLVEIGEFSAKQRSVPVSYPNFLDWRQQNAVFERLAASAIFPATLKSGGATDRIPVAYVTSEFLPVLRVQPALGRGFTAEDDSVAASPAAVLSHTAWKSRFGGNAAIVGNTVSLDGRSYTVIGVLPSDFRYYRRAEIFVPYAHAIRTYRMDGRANHSNTWAIARLKAGVTLEQARAQMAAIAKGLERQYPESNTGFGVRLTPLREYLTGNSKPAAMLLACAVAMVLLIACVNLASLLLARSAGRRKEIAIRAALGAGRCRVIGQLLTESMLLAVAGGALGLLLAQLSFAGLLRLAPAAEVAGGLHLDGRVLGFALLASIVTGILFGLAPALRTARVDLAESLKQGGRSATGAGAGRVRRALVITEVALASILLCGAGLLLRSVYSLTQVNPGFDAAQVVTMKVSLPANSQAASFQRGVRFYEELVERVSLLPGVVHAGVASSLAFTGESSIAPFYALDRPVPARGHMPEISHHVVSPGYFQALGIPLLKGRIFAASDGRVGDFRPEQAMEWFKQARLTVVLSESAARQFWPAADPVGKQLRFGTPEMNGPQLTVVGVVGDTRQRGLDVPAMPELYFSNLQFPLFNLNLVVRTTGDLAALVPAVRAQVKELDPDAPVARVQTMEQLVSATIAPRRSNLLLLGIFAAVALLLAAVGLYGLMANLVSQRMQEFGVRMAVGAAPARIMGMVVREGLALAAAGTAAGIVVALASARLIASMLFGVGTGDPMTYATVAAVLLAIGSAAAFVPARRACRVDPMRALRCE